MRVEDFYNKHASIYEDWIADPKNAVLYLKWVKNIFKKYNINQGSILDAGSGPGNLKMELGNKFKYTGIDVSEEMLSIAKAKGYEVYQDKMENVLSSFPDNTFDYTICLGSAFFVEDMQYMLNEFERISKKGFIIGFEQVTKEYRDTLTISEPVYDHTQFSIDDITEESFIESWVSPTTGYQMRTRMIFKQLKKKI